MGNHQSVWAAPNDGLVLDKVKIPASGPKIRLTPCIGRTTNVPHGLRHKIFGSRGEKSPNKLKVLIPPKQQTNLSLDQKVALSSS